MIVNVLHLADLIRLYKSGRSLEYTPRRNRGGELPCLFRQVLLPFLICGHYDIAFRANPPHVSSAHAMSTHPVFLQRLRPPMDASVHNISAPLVACSATLYMPATASILMQLLYSPQFC